HASVIFAEELQMNYVSELLKPVLQGKVGSFVPRNESTRSWNKWAQSCLNSHVWSGCASWYRADGADAKIFALWPGGNIHMWWSFRKPNWKHFEMVGGENWLLKRRALDSIGAILRVGLAVAGIGGLVLTALGQSNALVIFSQKTL
ncbi:unnamed protein product, partial [Rhizoctonia solani]